MRGQNKSTAEAVKRVWNSLKSHVNLNLLKPFVERPNLF